MGFKKINNYISSSAAGNWNIYGIYGVIYRTFTEQIYGVYGVCDKCDCSWCSKWIFTICMKY